MLQQLLLPHPPEVWLSSPKHMEDGVGSPAVSVLSIDNLLPSHRDYVTSLSWCLRSSLDLFQLVSQTPGCSIPPIPVLLTYVVCCGLWCCFGIFFLNMFLHTFLNVKSVAHSCHLSCLNSLFALLYPPCCYLLQFIIKNSQTT